MSNFKPQDHYFHLAKKDGYVARSAYKLEEIDDKFKLFDKNTKTVLDIGCAPGSRLQYTHRKLSSVSDDFQVVGIDLQKTRVSLKNVHTYEADMSDYEDIARIMKIEQIEKFDMIISDMAPNTIGVPNIDSMRSIGLLEKTLWLYHEYLAPNGKFAIKIFMGPGFDEFVKELKTTYGSKNIKIFKPKSCRDISKEIYIVKS